MWGLSFSDTGPGPSPAQWSEEAGARGGQLSKLVLAGDSWQSPLLPNLASLEERPHHRLPQDFSQLPGPASEGRVPCC